MSKQNGKSQIPTEHGQVGMLPDGRPCIRVTCNCGDDGPPHWSVILVLTDRIMDEVSPEAVKAKPGREFIMWLAEDGREDGVTVIREHCSGRKVGSVLRQVEGHFQMEGTLPTDEEGLSADAQAHHETIRVVSEALEAADGLIQSLLTEWFAEFYEPAVVTEEDFSVMHDGLRQTEGKRGVVGADFDAKMEKTRQHHADRREAMAAKMADMEFDGTMPMFAGMELIKRLMAMAAMLRMVNQFVERQDPVQQPEVDDFAAAIMAAMSEMGIGVEVLRM